MHRSGTSALSGLINLAGASIGQNIVKPHSDNPKGFFENQQVVDLNNRILKYFKSFEDDYNFLPINWLEDSKIKDYEAKIKTILDNEFGNFETILVKDPRICKTFPLWKKMLEENKFEVCPILNFRKIQNTASSISLRDGYSDNKSYLLCISHYLDALKSLENTRYLTVNYSDVLKNPEQIISTINKAFLTSLKIPSDEIDSFLDRKLNHSYNLLTNVSTEITELSKKVFIFIDNNKTENLNELLTIFQNILDKNKGWEDKSANYYRSKMVDSMNTVKKVQGYLQTKDKVIDEFTSSRTMIIAKIIGRLISFTTSPFQ